MCMRVNLFNTIIGSNLFLTLNVNEEKHHFVGR